MWFLIPVAGLVVAGIVALVSEEEKQARQSWGSKHERAKEEVQKRLEEIERHLASKQVTLDFYALNDSYYVSYKTADVAYKLLQEAKASVASLSTMLHATSQKRTEIRTKLGKKLNKSEKLPLIDELKNLTQFRDSLLRDRSKILLQKRELSEEVSRLNQQTEKLKIAMRDKCGEKGKAWYAELQSRISEKERLGRNTKT